MGQQPVVYLITGPMATGKSTVARLLASRFQRGVHLEGDVFRRSIVSGRLEMTPDPSPEALEQLRLRYGLAAAAADTYVGAEEEPGPGAPRRSSRLHRRQERVRRRGLAGCKAEDQGR